MRDAGRSDVKIKSYMAYGAFWAGGSKLLSLAMNLALYMILSRILSPAELGNFFLAFSIATFLSILIRFGLDVSTLHYVSDLFAKNLRDQVVGLLSRVSLLFSLSIAIFLPIFIFTSEKYFAAVLPLFDQDLVVYSIATLAVFIGIQFIVAEGFRGLHQISGAMIFGGLLSVSLSVFGLFLAQQFGVAIDLQKSLCVIVIAYVISDLASILFLSSRLRKHSINLKATDTPGISRILANSIPLAVSSLTMFFLVNSALWIVGITLSEESVALYGAAGRLVLLVNFTLSIANSFIPPLISKYKVNDDLKGLQHMLQFSAVVTAIPSVVLVSLFLSFPEFILTAVYGSSFFAEGSLVLAILSLGQLSSVLAGSAGFSLIMLGHNNTHMHISLFSCLLSVLLAYMLVPMFGIAGIASAYSIGMVVQQVSMVVALKRKSGVWSYANYRVLLEYLAVGKAKW
jgi:O-antigen/teichoic acid export membrane protein